MASQLKPGSPGVKGVRRLVQKQAGKALDELSAIGSSDADISGREAVHQVRKRLKRVRAMLRLIRSSIGDREYKRANESFRDAARPLTEVRDAHVLVTTFDKYCRDDDHLDRASLNTIKQALLVREQEVNNRVLSNPDALKSARDSLQSAVNRMDQWQLEKHGWNALGSGLKRVYCSGRGAYVAARQEPTVANLHEWRKQAKYFRYQLETIRSIWPLVLDDLSAKAKRLGDLLGDDHDLAMLREELKDAHRFPARDVVAELDRRMASKREEFQRKAFEAVEEMYDSRASAFTERLKECWRLWRKRPKAIAGTSV